MPLNSIPPTTTVENLAAKRSAAREQCWTDVAFWGGVIPGNQVRSFLFLSYLVEKSTKNRVFPLGSIGSFGRCWCQRIQMFYDRKWCRGYNRIVGVCLQFYTEDQTRNSHVSPKLICDLPCPYSRYDGCRLSIHSSAMRTLANTTQDKDTTLLFHAEMDDHHEGQPMPTMTSEDPTVYSTFLSSRPESFEVDAISRIIDLQKEFRSLRCHIVHLSAAQALPIIRRAKAAGHRLTVETCFHYLCLESDSIPDGRPEFKCCPPIRDAVNREALWAALLDGTINCVVSDHSPCVGELKKLDQGDIMRAWGGISTLGFGLSLLWTEGRKRNVPIGTILRWVSESTAIHAGLGDTKGKIAVGYDADLVIWDPDAQYTVRTASSFRGDWLNVRPDHEGNGSVQEQDHSIRRPGALWSG